MKHASVLAIGMMLLIGAAGAAVETKAAIAISTLTGVTIQSMNQEASQVTIHTANGQRLTLAVASRDLLQGLRRGDTCTLELDAEDRVITIVKIGLDQEPAPSER